MPMTPVEFLTARYDERERWAKACAELYPSPWDVYDRGHMAKVTADGPVYRNVTELDQAQAVGCAWLGDYLQHIAANDPAYALADIAAKRAILEWHQNWPVLVEKQPTFDQPAMATDFSSVTESVTVRLSRQIAWLTEQEYRNRFGSEPPTGPIIRLMLQPFAEHPDYDPKWTL